MQLPASKVAPAGLRGSRDSTERTGPGKGEDEHTCACYHLLNYTCRQGHQWQVREGSRVLQQERRVVRVSRTTSLVQEGGWVGAL